MNNTLRTIYNIKKLKTYIIKDIYFPYILTEDSFQKYINNTPLEDILQILHYQDTCTFKKSQLLNSIRIKLLEKFIDSFLLQKNIKILNPKTSYHFYEDVYHSILIYTLKNINLKQKISPSNHIWSQINDNSYNFYMENHIVRIQGITRKIDLEKNNEHDNYMFIFEDEEVSIDINDIKEYAKSNFNVEREYLSVNFSMNSEIELNIWKHLCLHFYILSYIVNKYIHISNLAYIQNNDK